MPTINKIYAVLKEVIDPTHNRDIVDLGYVQNIAIDGTKVSLDIILPDAAYPSAKEIKENAEKAVLQLIDLKEASINLKARSSAGSIAAALKDIKNIIAISSCKGGVGKSTVAVHMAMELTKQRFKVGLVDCDIYGPSLPAFFNLSNPVIHTNEKKQLLPIEHAGLRIMSFGFLLGDNAAVMRGPIVTRYIQQLLLNTAWGELDFLLIDMPPGTGDVHLTITQTIRLKGAVIVTTPHTLSLIDVARGILMFEKVNVPILGIVENMAFFQPPGSDTRHYIFGQSSAKNLEERFGIKTLAQIPLLEILGRLQAPEKSDPTISTAVREMLVSLEKLQKEDREPPRIDFNNKTIQLTFKDGRQWEVSNFDLRLNSQDALSIDEMTGEKKLKPENIRADITAKEITPLGNYAIGINWNDGHSAGIYSYKLIEELAKKK